MANCRRLHNAQHVSSMFWLAHALQRQVSSHSKTFAGFVRLLPLIYDGQARNFSRRRPGLRKQEQSIAWHGCHNLSHFGMSSQKNNKINRNSAFSPHIFSRMFTKHGSWLFSKKIYPSGAQWSAKRAFEANARIGFPVAAVPPWPLLVEKIVVRSRWVSALN